MKATLGRLALGLILMGAAAQLVAHHSFNSEYDENKVISVTGVVSKMEWTNPHARFYVDVKDASGKVTTWNFELASVNSLRRNGWTQFSLKVGETVTVKGYGAIANIPMGAASTVTLADGRSLFAETNAPSVQQTPR